MQECSCIVFDRPRSTCMACIQTETRVVMCETREQVKHAIDHTDQP